MSTEAQILANRVNAEHSTGPRTEEGKAASSRNRLTLGLFTQRDFIQAGEQEEHTRLTAALWAELNPQTVLEQTYATAIISATWRLRRCSQIEDNMSEYIHGDPMENGFGDTIQKPVDRARSQAFNRLQRSTAELRRLQTDRALRHHLADSNERDLVSYQQIVSTLTQAKRAKILPFHPDSPELASNCQTPESTPRNAPCPCGSGQKYKRCCGEDAPPVLGPLSDKAA
jgi:hypothetical protein